VTLPATLRTVDRVPVPWKDGGGITRLVAVFPAAAGPDDFEWRVSMAEVGVRGPFSRFTNVDRVLLVLEGCLELDFVQTARTILLEPGQQHAFGGDVPVVGTPIGGLVHDLNIMVRRGVWTAQVRLQRPDSITGICIAIASRGCGPIAPLDAILLDDAADIPPDFVGYFIEMTRT
jgi:environmental stress-induced protein Ves